MTLSESKLFVQVRKEIRSRKLSYRTEKAYLDWIYRYFVFNNKINPSEMNPQHLATFLSFLAVKKQVSSSTQNQAFHALMFLYRYVLQSPPGKIRYIKVRQSTYFPKVFTRDEVKLILGKLKGEKWLIASLLYGCGLSLNECLSLRIQDIDLLNDEIIITDHSSDNLRTLALPKNLKEVLRKRIELLKYNFMLTGLRNFCGVSMPVSWSKAIPDASKTFEWYYLFPAKKPSKDRQTGKLRVHHRSEPFIQKTIRKCLKSCGIMKKASCHTFRHSYAIHLLESGYDIRVVQQLLGHKNIRNTMVYSRIMNQGKVIPKSPLDSLFE